MPRRRDPIPAWRKRQIQEREAARADRQHEALRPLVGALTIAACWSNTLVAWFHPQCAWFADDASEGLYDAEKLRDERCQFCQAPIVRSQAA